MLNLLTSLNSDPLEEQEPIQPSEIQVVIGRRGSGKTTLVKKVLIPELTAPFIIFDTINEYDDVPDVQMVDDIPSLIDAIEMQDNIRVIGEGGSISFPELAEIIDKSVRNYTLIVDEFHVLFDHHMTFKKENPAFKRIVLLGRHSGVGLIIISQRATDIPQEVLSMSTKLFVFHVFRKKDINFLDNVMPNPEQAATLGTFEFLEVDLTAAPPTTTLKKLQITFDKPEQIR